MKCTRIKFINYSLTSDIPTPASGQLAFASVAGRLYSKDSSGNVQDLQAGTPIARTATADGTGTGTIAKANTTIVPTSDDANKIIILPAMAAGDWVWLLPETTATGYELRTSSPTTISLNNVSGADKELAVAAATSVFVKALSATAYIASKYDNVGSDTGAGTPD